MARRNATYRDMAQTLMQGKPPNDLKLSDRGVLARRLRKQPA
jgi:hypothetical protein